MKVMKFAMVLALAGTMALDVAGKGKAVAVLHTNDMHTHMEGAAESFSQIAGELNRLKSFKEAFILVDAGDFSQGTSIGTFDKGMGIIQLMNAAGYQVATPGNHEFDYGMEVFYRNYEAMKFAFVSCNFIHRKSAKDPGELVLKRYAVAEANGIKVAFVGISTPFTVISSNPMVFMDKTNTYREWDFIGSDNPEDLYRAVQDAVNDAAKEAEYVVALGHLGIGEECEPFRSIDVIARTTNICAFVDGHSHSELTGRRVKNALGQEVVLTQSGSYMGVLGSIALSEGSCTAAGTVFSKAPRDPVLMAMERELMENVNRQLGKCIAKAPVSLYAYTPKTRERIPRWRSCGLADMSADAYWWYVNEVSKLNVDVGLINGGNVRADIPAGEVNTKTIMAMQPFNLDLAVIEVSGQQLLDALEFGAHVCGISENGGYMHPAGLTYCIDVAVRPTSKVDRSGKWLNGPANGKYRVHSVKVYERATGEWKALDLEKTYRVVGTAFIMRNGGDGFAMFNGSKVIADSIVPENTALSEFLKAFKKGADGIPELTSAASPLNDLKNYPINYESPIGTLRSKRVARQ